jgi:hypothetical protein
MTARTLPYLLHADDETDRAQGLSATGPYNRPGNRVNLCAHDGALGQERRSRSMLWGDGAGEGIRTLDFNLGKVALYP